MRMYRATQPTTPGVLERVLERVLVLVGDSCARAPRMAAAQRRNRAAIRCYRFTTKMTARARGDA
jgi:hypothetical protein